MTASPTAGPAGARDVLGALARAHVDLRRQQPAVLTQSPEVIRAILMGRSPRLLRGDSNS